MKAIIVFLAAFVILTAVTPASAQDWVMNWTSRGSSVGILTGPFSEGWTISGTSPTSLSPRCCGRALRLAAQLLCARLHLRIHVGRP